VERQPQLSSSLQLIWLVSDEEKQGKQAEGDSKDQIEEEHRAVDPSRKLGGEAREASPAGMRGSELNRRHTLKCAQVTDSFFWRLDYQEHRKPGWSFDLQCHLGLSCFT